MSVSKRHNIPAFSSGNMFSFFSLEFTDLVLPHLLQLVHRELLLLQAVEHDVAQAGELAERVGKAPQPLVDHLAEGEEPIGHRRPALPQGDLEQGPDDPGRVLREGATTKKLSPSQISLLMDLLC